MAVQDAFDLALQCEVERRLEGMFGGKLAVSEQAVHEVGRFERVADGPQVDGALEGAAEFTRAQAAMLRERAQERLLPPFHAIGMPVRVEAAGRARNHCE